MVHKKYISIDVKIVISVNKCHITKCDRLLCNQKDIIKVFLNSGSRAKTFFIHLLHRLSKTENILDQCFQVICFTVRPLSSATLGRLDYVKLKRSLNKAFTKI